MSTCHFVDAIGRIVPAETSVYIYIRFYIDIALTPFLTGEMHISLSYLVLKF